MDSLKNDFLVATDLHLYPYCILTRHARRVNLHAHFMFQSVCNQMQQTADARRESGSLGVSGPARRKAVLLRKIPPGDPQALRRHLPPFPPPPGPLTTVGKRQSRWI